jgi:Rad3-related DNA helicase
MAAIEKLLPDAIIRPSKDNVLVLDPGARQLPELLELGGRVAGLASSVDSLCSLLDQSLSRELVEPNAYALRELELFTNQLKGRMAILQEAFLRPLSDRLYWTGLERRSGRALVQAAPTSAGRVLQEKALSEKQTAVFTSASLAVAESFTYFRRGVGLESASAYEMVLASPFDYLSQALLCLPTDLFELTDPLFLDQAAETVASISRRLEGRTLVLFTAHQQLRDVAGRLRILTAQDGLAVLAQNVDGTRRQILQQFQDDARTVLLGTSSFWEGIDVPGDALSCVVIVRLPFRVPSDPLQLARSAALRDPFAELALPEAVLRLKQGFGRLIRRQSDRGAVLLLDHRIANRDYGQAFLDALPRAAVHVGACEEMAPAIAQWLKRPVAA